MTDSIDWSGALAGSTETVREIRWADRPPNAAYPVCRCGATERYGRATNQIANLRGLDIDAVPSEGIQRCRACPHNIAHRQMCIRLWHPGSNYSDHYHRECVEI